MLNELITWWVEQMRSLLPQRLSARSSFADALVVRATPAGLSAAARRRGAETPLGVVQPGNGALRRLRARPPGPTVLALPAASLLEQAASLPLAAERDLAAVLRHEMDRLTPFAADDLYWTWRVERRDRVQGRLLLRLLLVPKLALQSTLAAMDAAGLRPAAIEVVRGAGFEHLSLAAPGAPSGRGSAVVAAWVCAALALALCVVPIVRQEWAISQVEARVDALRPRVALVDGLRRRVAANTGSADLFAAESARVGNPLRALAAVTAALPDDTYLTSFSMRERKLSLAGRSATAPRLIAALSADPELRDPAFDAPVTRVGDKADLFSIRTELAP